MQIYVSRHGQRYGPYSRAGLDQQLDSGTFDFDDFASTDGGRSWLPLRSLPGAAPFEVLLDAPRNLLMIRYRGRVSPAQVERCAVRAEAALAKLKAGFALVVDLSRLDWMDPLCAPQIGKIMDSCNKAGVSVVARVIADVTKDIGLRIMSYFHYDPHVRILTCASLEEAHTILWA